MCFVSGKNVMFLSSANSPEHAFKIYNVVAFLYRNLSGAHHRRIEN